MKGKLAVEERGEEGKAVWGIEEEGERRREREITLQESGMKGRIGWNYLGKKEGDYLAEREGGISLQKEGGGITLQKDSRVTLQNGGDGN